MGGNTTDGNLKLRRKDRESRVEKERYIEGEPDEGKLSRPVRREAVGAKLERSRKRWQSTLRYEYSDYEPSIKFDSYMKDSTDLEDGQLRLLEVDNRVVLPASSKVRVIVTSSDVLHSWAVPSLGVKVDAIPGRLNQVSIMLDREGIYYGQCSELCLRLDRNVDLRENQNKLESRIVCPSVLRDVIRRELGLKQVNKIADHELSNLMNKIKTYVRKDVGRWGWSSNLREAALKVEMDYDGFLTRLLKDGQNIKDKVSHKILSSNGKMEGIFRSTGLKNTLIKSICISKLGKPGIREEIIDLPRESVPTSKEGIWLGKLNDRVAGGMMETKRTGKGNQKFPAYRSGRDLLALKPQIVTGRMYSSISGDKRDNVNRSLTKRIKAEIGKGEWIKADQRAELKEFIRNCQTNLSALGKKGEYNKVNHLMEIMLSSLVFQVNAIETMVKNKGSGTPGLDGKILLENNAKSKIEMLKEIKKWRNRKPSKLRRIYKQIPKGEGKQRKIRIPSIIDRTIQQLFLLVIDPVVEAKSDSNSFGFRKGRKRIMAIGGIEKELQSKVREKVVREGYIWDAGIKKCLDTKNHAWLMRNTPIPRKLKYILKGWLEAGYIEFGTENIKETKEGEGGISHLLMNICLNGLEELLEESMEENKKGTLTATRRDREKDGLRLSIKNVGKTGKYKEREIDLKMIRYGDDFIVISGSARLLEIVKGKFAEFLRKRGLEINMGKSRVIELGEKKPLNFLGYTFVYQKRTENKRSKLVQGTSSRREGRPRLYVFPSEEEVKRLKKRLKNYLKENQNSEAFKIIGELNQIIRGWENYFAYSNARGTLRKLRAWLLRRLEIWTKRKHPKAGREWLRRRYFGMDEAIKEYKIKERDEIEIKARSESSEKRRANKRNFYGIARKHNDKQKYGIPKVNELWRPDRIKEMVKASDLMPGRSILGDSYYLRREEWMKEKRKIRKMHEDKENKLETKEREKGNAEYETNRWGRGISRVG